MLQIEIYQQQQKYSIISTTNQRAFILLHVAHVCACVRTLFYSNSEKLTDNLLNVSTLPNNKEKQKVVLILSFFFFFLTKFGYKLSYSLRLQLHSNMNFFLLNMNFDKFNIELYFIIISFILAKFSKFQRSITMSSIKYLNFKFLQSKIMHKK